MRTGPRRRRGLLLLSLSLASGGLAASEVSRKVSDVEARAGAPVPVVVARADLAAGKAISEGSLGRLLGVREVPERFAPPDALATPSEATGLAPAVPIAAGSYLTVGHFAAGDSHARGGLLRPGERAVEVAVAGGEALAGARPGTRVDVLVSTEPRTGTGQTFVALEGVELLGLGGTTINEGMGPETSSTATALATLRVTLRQAVYLTAAQNFAREVRLLPRPAGDRRRLGRFGISAAGL